MQSKQSLDSKLVVSGGNKLSGHVNIDGSKNSALPILAATLCCSGTSMLHNVPDLVDTKVMASVLESLGAEVDGFDGGLLVNSNKIQSVQPCSDDIGKIRGGFLVVGPLLGRFGEAVVALPGGCNIGARPIDLYIRGLRALGAVVELRDSEVRAYAENGKGLIGGTYRLDYPSVGATECLIMAACLADGETVFLNVAREPEVIDLVNFLIACGACIEGAGSNTIRIYGRQKLCGSEFTIMPDRIEAGTFMLAAAITRSSISISPVIPDHLSCLVDKLAAAGCRITCSGNTLQISAVPTNPDVLQGFDIATSPFPGFPTDLQPQTMAFLTTCNGSSVVEEIVFESRMGHAIELEKLGSRIDVSGHTAVVYGKDKGSSLHGSCVLATDLRGGASLVLAGLAAEGITEINGATHIDRGYVNLEGKLRQLGADIRRFNNVAPP